MYAPTPALDDAKTSCGVKNAGIKLRPADFLLRIIAVSIRRTINSAGMFPASQLGSHVIGGCGFCFVIRSTDSYISLSFLSAFRMSEKTSPIMHQIPQTFTATGETWVISHCVSGRRKLMVKV